jgi:hypothetical protein
MAEPHQDGWFKDTFGVDPAAFAQKAAGAVADGIKNVGQAAGEEIHKAEDAIASAGKAAGEAIAAKAKQVEQEAEAVAEAVAKKAADAVQSVKSGIEKGIEKAKDALSAGAKDVADDVVAAETAKYDAAMKELDGQIQKLTSLGLDSAHYTAQATAIRANFADAMKLHSNAARVFAIGALMQRANQAASDAKTDVAHAAKSAIEGVGHAVTDMRDGARKQIDALPKDSKEKPELAKRLDDLNALIGEVGKITAPAEHAKKLKQVNVAAESLFDDAAAASHDAQAMQAVYAQALKDRYGIEIDNPAGMKNTHLDQVYKMFDKVPDADVAQGKLKKLVFQPLNRDGTKNDGAAYGDAEIDMGDYGDETWDYQNPDPTKASPPKPNGFSISTLHELGHSVDDRFKIMDANQAKPGGGGWRVETIQSTAQAYIGQFTSGAGRAARIDDKTLAALVEDSLAGKAPGRPDKVSDEDWALLKPLLRQCASRRNDQWPWGSPHDIGGRAYHESYAGQWVSYDMAARAKPITVRDYQWRAPGEFFAELYAYGYYNSTPPPNGIDPAITAYLFGGKAASSGAPSASP